MSEASRKQSTTLAERFLNDARAKHWPVSLYLISGFQLKGEIVEFDQETILFNHKNVHQLVMRSAIASMYPVPDSKQGAGEWWLKYAPAAARQKPG